MPKTRLEISSAMHSIEKRLDLLHQQRKAISSHYFKEGFIQFEIESDDFRDKGHDTPIQFDKDLMIAYLTSEIDKLNKQSDDLLVELSQIKR